VSVIGIEGAAAYYASDWHSVSCFESKCPFLFCDLPLCTEKTVIPTSCIIYIDRYRWREICKSLVLVIIINTSRRFFSQSELLLLSYLASICVLVGWLGFVAFFSFFFYFFLFFGGFCVLLAMVVCCFLLLLLHFVFIV